MIRLALRMDWVRPEIVEQMQASRERALAHLDDCPPCRVIAFLSWSTSSKPDYTALCPALQFEAAEFMRLRDRIVAEDGRPGPAMKDDFSLEYVEWHRRHQGEVHQN